MRIHDLVKQQLRPRPPEKEVAKGGLQVGASDFERSPAARPLAPAHVHALAVVDARRDEGAALSPRPQQRRGDG